MTASRTVKVKLKASVGDYVKDVSTATAATRALRKEAERFEKRYVAVLDVRTKGGSGAASGLASVEKSMKAASKASDQLKTDLAGLRKEIASLEKNGPSLRMSGRDSIVAEIAKVKRHLASLNHQAITIPIATEITQGNIELADLERRLKKLDASRYTPEVDLQLDKLRKQAAEVHAELEKLGTDKRPADELDRTKKAAYDSAGAFQRLSRYTRRSRNDLLGLARQTANTQQALRQLSMTPLAIGLVPQIGSLIGSSTQLLKILGFIPAGVLALGSSIGIMVAGLDGMIDAVKDGGEALDKLAPNARKVAVELRSQSKAWREVQQAIQQALFKGQVDRFDDLGRIYLPLIERYAGGIATQLGAAANAFYDFMLEGQSIGDTVSGLRFTEDAMRRLGPIIAESSRMFRDFAAVGARELPRTADNLEVLVRRWSDAVSRARANGDLSKWLKEGRAEAVQLGNILRDTGGILKGLGEASQAAGIDTVAALQRGTAAAHQWVDSWQGQAAIRSTMSELRNDVNAFIPGLRDLAGLALDFVQHLSGSGTFQQLGDTFSSLAASARPVAEVLGQLTAAVLRPLLGLVQTLAPALGPLIAGMIALRTASRGVSRVQSALATTSTAITGVATSAGVSTVAAGRFAGAMSKVASALPVLGFAALGVAAGYELLRDRANEAAQGVLNGSLNIQEAINKEVGALERKKLVSDALTQSQEGYAMGQLLANEQTDKAKEAADRRVEAERRVNEEIQKLIDAGAPLEAANMRVTWRQQQLNDALSRFHINSPQVREAQAALTEAGRQLEIQQYASALGTDVATAALIRQKDTFRGVQDAELALADAKARADEAARTNTATMDINTEAGRNNRRALLDLATASQNDLEARFKNGESIGVINERLTGHRDQLIKTAERMGMNRDEATKYVDQLNLVPAEVATEVKIHGIDTALSRVGQLETKINGLYIGPGQLAGPGDRPGERVPTRASGGPISGPGSGTSDSILARVSDGEWVIKASTVDDLGDEKLAALNAGRADIVPKYATGGRVGSAPATGGVPKFAVGGQVTGAIRSGGSLGGALAAIQSFRTEVGRVWDGLVGDTDRKFGTVESTVGTRLGNTTVTGTGAAAGLASGVSGAFGTLPGATEGAFGAVQGTVGARMLATQQGATGEAGNLQRGVTGAFSTTQLESDRLFGLTRDAVTARMAESRDNANRTAGETDRGVSGAFGSLQGSAARIFLDTMLNARRKWDELKESVNSPVRWVIDTAWNKGAAALWGAAAKIFPLGAFPAAKYATGGPVYGPGTGTSDSIPAMLSNQEHVWTAREVKGAGGHGEVARLRAMAGSGQLAQFAQGGAWQGMFGQVKQKFPAARLTSGVRPGDPGYHGRGQAIDIAGPRSMDMPFMLAVNRWIAGAMADKTELIHTQPGAVNMKNGRPHTYNAATQAGHRNHVHWATGGPGPQGPGGVFGFAVDMLASALEGPKNALRAMAGPKTGVLAGDIKPMGADWIIAQAEAVLRKKADEMDAAMMAGINGGGGGGRAGAEKWRPLVLQALQMMGQPASLVERVLMQIGTESGGDPRAVNNWDINAKRGTPSGGLLQTILPTYNRHADPRRNLGMFDPLSNILASMRYALHRYGSLTAAYRGVGYHQGGVIPGTGAKDDKLVLAQSGERVLTTGQNERFERLVDLLDKPTPASPAALFGGGAGGGSSVVNNFHNENHFTEAVDLDLFNQRQDFAVRSASFGG